MTTYVKFLISLSLSISLIVSISDEHARAQNTGYALSVSSLTVAPGATITVSWSAPGTHMPTDWVGLFQVGHNDSDASVVSWQHVPAQSSGTMSFKSPNVLTSRQYELRYFLNNGFVKTATSNPVTVTLSSTSSTSYSVTAAPSTAAPGSTITVLWKAPSTHAATDWIGLFQVGHSDSDPSVISWKYVPGVTSGTMSFKAPNVSTSNKYEVRYFLDNGFNRTATSNPVNVTQQTTTGGATSTTTTQSSTGTSSTSSTSTSTSMPTSTSTSPTTTPTSTPTSTPSAGAGPCPNGKQIAFPGAEGAGRCSQGGRGGPVINVTNLNDSGPGSLRECLEVMSGPRICRPMVAGWVSLHGESIIINHDYVTFDGSMPGAQPMGVKDGGITVRASHTIFRHLRVFPGLYQWLVRQPPQNANGIQYLSYDGGGPSHDHICDHCSFGWTSDDTLSYFFGTDRATCQYCLLYEAMECPTCNNRGLLIQGTVNGGGISIWRSVQAHTYIRWPEIVKGNADIVNTIEYNSHGTPAQIFPVYGDVHVNFVGNVFKDGPNAYAPPNEYSSIRTLGGQPYTAGSSIYVHDNIGRYYANGVLVRGLVTPDRAIVNGDNGGIPVSAARYPLPLMPTIPAAQAYDDVLNTAGAFPLSASDARVVNEIRTGTGRWRYDVDDAGGWPILPASGAAPADNDQDGMPNNWELSHGLNPNNPSDGPLDANGDGFTNLDEYLNSLSPQSQ